MTAFAFVFPGQGSQTVGMLDAWGDNPAVRQTLAEASDALGEDVAKLIREGPKERLDLTSNTQPVMLTAGIACYRAWMAQTNRPPALVAGHSLGEYTALVAAGSLRIMVLNSSSVRLPSTRIKVLRRRGAKRSARVSISAMPLAVLR